MIYGHVKGEETWKQGGDRQEEEDGSKEGRDRGEYYGIVGNEEEDFLRGQVEAQLAQRYMKLPSSDVAQQILGLDNINTNSACQSQGFLFNTFFFFYPFQPIYKEKVSHCSFQSHIHFDSQTLWALPLLAGKHSCMHCFPPHPPCCAYFKCIIGLFQPWQLYCTAEGQ